MRTILAVPGLLLLLSAGCATAVHGTYETVPVDSFPRGAQIAVACGHAPADAGVTPASVQLERAAKDCRLTLSKSGYDTKVVVFERQKSRATTANKVVGVPVGLITAIGLGFVTQDWLDSDDLLIGGFEAGFGLGDTIDEHSGGAYKQVPGQLYVVLVRTPKSQE